MKKILALSLVLLMTLGVNAQRFGARIGGNFSGMMSTVETKGTKIAPGLNVGLLAEFGPKIVNAHIEVNYAQKGFNVNLEEDNLLKKSKFNIDYLEVPVLLKFNPPVLPLYFYAGPYFGLALKGNTEITDYEVDGTDMLNTLDDVDTDLFTDNSFYKRSDFGVAAGLGSQFGLGPIHAFVEGRATLGLSNLYDTETDAFQALVDQGAYKDTDHLKNMAFTLGVGIILGK